MTSDLDIYRSAQALIKQHGRDAPIHAAMRADAMLEKGDLAGCAAWKRPKFLLALWPVLLLWGAALVIAPILIFLATVAVVAMVGASSFSGVLLVFVIMLVGVALMAAVGVMFMTVIFRCVGLLGRHDPELMETLPDEVPTAKLAGIIGAGVVAKIIE